MTKFLVPLFALALLLSACNSTVITEEDRKLPESSSASSADEEREPVAMEKDAQMEKKDAPSVPASSAKPTAQKSSDRPVAAPKVVTKTADLSQSFIAFTGTKGSAMSQQGKFTNFSVELTVTDGAPTDLQVGIVIDSMVTGSQGLTDHLLNPDFFESETWPTATFTSSSITKVSGDTYTVSGTLTMHGKSNNETITMTITDTYITGQHLLNRTNYGIGAPPGGIKSIDAGVPIDVKVVFN